MAFARLADTIARADSDPRSVNQMIGALHPPAMLLWTSTGSVAGRAAGLDLPALRGGADRFGRIRRPLLVLFGSPAIRADRLAIRRAMGAIGSTPDRKRADRVRATEMRPSRGIRVRWRYRANR